MSSGDAMIKSRESNHASLGFERSGYASCSFRCVVCVRGRGVLGVGRMRGASRSGGVVPDRERLRKSVGGCDVYDGRDADTDRD